MKRYIACSEVSNALRERLRSPELDYLIKKMSPNEKRIVGRFANAKEVEGYAAGLLDACELLGPDISDEFNTFVQIVTEELAI